MSEHQNKYIRRKKFILYIIIFLILLILFYDNNDYNEYKQLIPNGSILLFNQNKNIYEIIKK